jgi:type II secretion system protein G
MKRGFTLIELVIVIAMLGLFAVAVLAVLNPLGQIQKANDARRKTDLEQVQRALEVYYQDNGSYPSNSSNYRIQVVVAGKTTELPWGSAFLTYMNKLPADPNASHTYVYYSPASSNGQTYYLYASLDRGSKDPQACNSGSACTTLGVGSFPSATACGGTCNFGVSSSNVTP